jgi:hypothetical protein
MNEQLKKDALILCERIRELTKQVDNKIENIDNSPQNIKIKVDDNEISKKNVIKPAAGRKGTKWDNTIIHWKTSLRSPW